MRWLVVGALINLCCLAYGRDSGNARLAAVVRSTKTAFFLTTSTTTTPFTCAIATNLAVCQRRRYLRYSAIDDLTARMPKALIHGSMLDTTNPEVAEEAMEDRDPRLALTFRVTTTSTLTITSTSINSAITFSLSFFCTVNGAQYPPACG